MITINFSVHNILLRNTLYTCSGWYQRREELMIYNTAYFNFIKHLPETKKVKFFLEKSYGIELLFFLYEHNNFSGIENLYYEIKYPKGKLPSFRKFIYYLNDKKCLEIVDNNKILREKIVVLHPDVFLELDAILKFYKQQ